MDFFKFTYEKHIQWGKVLQGKAKKNLDSSCLYFPRKTEDLKQENYFCDKVQNVLLSRMDSGYFTEGEYWHFCKARQIDFHALTCSSELLFKISSKVPETFNKGNQ